MKYTNLYDNKQVEALVEVRLYDPVNQKDIDIKKTSISEGQYPEWNELLDFPLYAKDRGNGGACFSKKELAESKLILYFTLFDVETKRVQISKNQTTFSTDNHYLGSFSIPLTTILTTAKFEGQVRVNRPIVL